VGGAERSGLVEGAARALRWLACRRFWLLLAFTYFYFHQGSDPNQTSRMALVHAMVDRHATDITPEHALTIDKGRYAGKMYSDKAPGVAFVLAPAYAIVEGVDHVLGRSSDDRGIQRARLHVMSFVAAGIPGVLATFFVLETLILLGASRPIAELLAAGYGLGTLVLPFSTLIFGHVLAACLVAGAFYLLQKWRVAGESIGFTRAIGLGAIWGSSLVVEYPTGLLVAVSGLYALSFEPRPRAALRVLGGCAVGAAAPFALHVAFTWVTYGSLFTLPYKYLVEPIFLGSVSTGVLGIGIPTKLGVWGVYVSRYRGLFFLCPFLALVFAGFSRWAASRTLRREMWASAAAIVLYSVFATSYYAWDGGGSTGCRHLIPALAFFVFAIAPFASSGKWPLAITASLVVISITVMYLSTAVIVQVPEAGPYEGNPFYDIVVSSLLRGDLDHNLQDAFYPRLRADASYNLGTLVGIGPMTSLLVPPLAWALAYAGPWLGRVAAWRRAHAVA
jgi:hypothetical protein